MIPHEDRVRSLERRLRILQRLPPVEQGRIHLSGVVVPKRNGGKKSAYLTPKKHHGRKEDGDIPVSGGEEDSREFHTHYSVKSETEGEFSKTDAQTSGISTSASPQNPHLALLLQEQFKSVPLVKDTFSRNHKRYQRHTLPSSTSRSEPREGTFSSAENPIPFRPSLLQKNLPDVEGQHYAEVLGPPSGVPLADSSRMENKVDEKNDEHTLQETGLPLSVKVEKGCLPTDMKYLTEKEKPSWASLVTKRAGGNKREVEYEELPPAVLSGHSVGAPPGTAEDVDVGHEKKGSRKGSNTERMVETVLDSPLPISPGWPSALPPRTGLQHITAKDLSPFNLEDELVAMKKRKLKRAGSGWKTKRKSNGNMQDGPRSFPTSRATRPPVSAPSTASAKPPSTSFTSRHFPPCDGLTPSSAYRAPTQGSGGKASKPRVSLPSTSATCHTWATAAEKGKEAGGHPLTWSSSSLPSPAAPVVAPAISDHQHATGSPSLRVKAHDHEGGGCPLPTLSSQTAEGRGYGGLSATRWSACMMGKQGGGSTESDTARLQEITDGEFSTMEMDTTCATRPSALPPTTLSTGPAEASSFPSNRGKRVSLPVSCFHELTPALCDVLVNLEKSGALEEARRLQDGVERKGEDGYHGEVGSTCAHTTIAPHDDAAQHSTTEDEEQEELQRWLAKVSRMTAAENLAYIAALRKRASRKKLDLMGTPQEEEAKGGNEDLPHVSREEKMQGEVCEEDALQKELARETRRYNQVMNGTFGFLLSERRYGPLRSSGTSSNGSENPTTHLDVLSVKIKRSTNPSMNERPPRAEGGNRRSAPFLGAALSPVKKSIADGLDLDPEKEPKEKNIKCGHRQGSMQYDWNPVEDSDKREGRGNEIGRGELDPKSKERKPEQISSEKQKERWRALGVVEEEMQEKERLEYEKYARERFGGMAGPVRPLEVFLHTIGPSTRKDIPLAGVSHSSNRVSDVLERLERAGVADEDALAQHRAQTANPVLPSKNWRLTTREVESPPAANRVYSAQLSSSPSNNSKSENEGREGGRVLHRKGQCRETSGLTAAQGCNGPFHGWEVSNGGDETRHLWGVHGHLTDGIFPERFSQTLPARLPILPPSPSPAPNTRTGGSHLESPVCVEKEEEEKGEESFFKQEVHLEGDNHEAQQLERSSSDLSSVSSSSLSSSRLFGADAPPNGVDANAVEQDKEILQYHTSESREAYQLLYREYGSCLDGTEEGLLDLWKALGGQNGWKKALRPAQLSLLLSKERIIKVRFRVLHERMACLGGSTVPCEEVTTFFSVLLSRLPYLELMELFDCPKTPFDWETIRRVHRPFPALRGVYFLYTAWSSKDALRLCKLCPSIGMEKIRTDTSIKLPKGMSINAVVKKSQGRILIK